MSLSKDGLKTRKRHPLFVKDVFARDVARRITTDRVALVFRAVRVELAARVAGGDVDLCPVPEPMDLDVHVRLDKVRGGDGAIRDETGAVARLGAVGDDNGLDVADEAVGAGLGRAVDAEIVHAVERDEARVGRLVDGGADGQEGRGVGVGRAVWPSGGHLSPGERGGVQEGAEEREEGEHDAEC